MNGICFDCWILDHTTTKATSTGCGCANGWIWSSSTNSCVCPTGYVMMGSACFICSQAIVLLPSGVTLSGCTACSNSEGFTLNNGICYACSTLPYTTGAALSTGCVCSNSSLFWVPSTSSCACNFYTKGFYTFLTGSSISCVQNSTTSWSCGQANNIYSNGFCIQCAGLPNSNGLSYNGQCMCYSGYKFDLSSYPFKCACSYLKAAYVTGNSCMNCTNFTSTGTPNFDGCMACSASQGFLYVPSVDTCILCSTKTNSNGLVVGNGCGCISGIWS